MEVYSIHVSSDPFDQVVLDDIIHAPFLAIFKHMIAFADRHNLRIICVNLRDYPGSTPYTPAELEAIHNGNHDEQVAFVKARGLELGAFLAWFIRTANIPAPANGADAGETSGGLSLFAWSGGNCIAMSLIAYADHLPEQDQELLERYLRSYIIFGAHSATLLDIMWRFIYHRTL